MEPNIITVIASLLGSGVISAVITWQGNKRLEKMKAALERGLYVTKAHYDLELESFKKVWTAFSLLRLRCRAFTAPDKFKIKTPDGDLADWFVRAYPNIMKDFFDAHDTVVRVVNESAPFYPANIRLIAERIFVVDLDVVAHVSNLDGTELSEPWFDKFRLFSKTIDIGVQEMEEQIRARLTTMRIVT